MIKIGFFFLIICSSSIFADDSEFSIIFADYKKGNYDSVSRLSERHLTASNSEKDPRIFFLYVSTESNWTKLKKNITKSPEPHFLNSTQFWNAIYLFMERALVFGENDLIVKWGKEFQKNAKQSPKYADGLYIYATSVLELKNIEEAKRIISQIDEQALSENMKPTFQELKQSLNQ